MRSMFGRSACDGLVMIEAMACGTPVIAFNRGSVPEVVDDRLIASSSKMHRARSELSTGFRSSHERRSVDTSNSLSRRAAWRSSTSPPIAA
jgi:glycosyltransferase involved in cell wall biosynthesis